MKYLNFFKRSAAVAASLLFFSGASHAAVFTVGAGGNFADLAAALADLNTSSLTGPVVYNILPGTYSGPLWQGVINNVTNASAANNITFQPQGPAGSVIINVAGSSSVPYIFKLNGASYVTIKNLTLNNTSTSYGTSVLIAGSSAHDSIIGCTMSTPTTTSNNADMAIIQAGTSSLPLTGGNIVISGNTFTKGSAGIWLYGPSGGTSFTDDDIIDNNTFTNNYYYGVYLSNAGNLKMRNNTINSNSTGIYAALYLNSTVNGLDVSGNIVAISTTSGTHYGMYNNAINTAPPTAPASSSIANNNISVTVTSGVAWSLYNLSCNDLDITGNTFLAKATSSGKVYPPVVAYGGVNINATGNTFTAQCTSGGINTDGQPLIRNANTTSPNNITVRKNTFNYITTSGTIGTSSTSAIYLYYPINCTINSNQYNVTFSSSATMYGLGYYFMQYGTNTTVDSNKFTYTTPSGGTVYMPQYYYGIYYGSNNSFSNDTVRTMNNASLTFYGLGTYFGYNTTNLRHSNCYYKITSTSSTIYTPYYWSYLGSGGEYSNNTFDITGTGGTIYSPYYFKYSTPGRNMIGNSFKVSATSASVTCPYYLNYSGANDTIENNRWDVALTTGTINSYKYYTLGLVRNNTFKFKTTSGTIYNYIRYPQNGLVAGNTFDLSSTSGTIYGLYHTGTTGDNAIIQGNYIKARSTSGTVYGYYISYPYGNAFISNVFDIKTGGQSYLLDGATGLYGDVKFFNNTFHSSSTGTSKNVLLKTTAGSSTYHGKFYLYNNIFSRGKAANDNAVDIADTQYCITDHNLYYSPDSITFNCGTPAFSTISLSSWRTGTGRDENSLYGDPGYTDAANGNFLPAASNPSSWNASGRGIHMPGDTVDMNNAHRPKTRFEGVPDIGAYEFTPASIPADAVAIPATPSASTRQSFLVGGDTAFVIQWGSVVPASVSVKQYTGVQAGSMPYPGVGRTYNYVKVTAPNGVYDFMPRFYYKDPQLGDISSETNAKIARSANGGTWMGFNYTNALTDSVSNILYPANNFDSLGSFTGVENARIGIRCVVSPSGLSHSNITAFTADESWDEVFSPLGYQVVIDSTVTNPTSTATLFFTPTNTIAIGKATPQLKEFTKYYIHVRTICGVKDTSDWSVDSLMTIITCHAPEPKLTSVTGTQAVIYWDTVRTASMYESVLDQSPSDPVAGLPSPNNTFLSQSLQPNNTYYFHTRSHCKTMYDKSDWKTIQFNTWTTNVDDLQKNTMVLFPNPVKNRLSVKLSAQPDGEATIIIMDIAGREMYRAAISTADAEFNLSALPAGIYSLHYTDRKGTAVTKITKD